MSSRTFVCPCAWCRGEWGQPGAMAGRRPEELGEQETSMADLALVGRYAVQPTWADGHSTGIYAFRALRALCPCGSCGAGLVPEESGG